ncbi:Subtilisin [compost metagenome]
MKSKGIFFLVLLFSMQMLTGCTSDNVHSEMNHSKMNHSGMNHSESDKSFLDTKNMVEVHQREVSKSISYWHNKDIKGSNVKIALMDTGIDLSNNDLVFVKGANFVGANIENFEDNQGHGTKIAGIIGARENNFNLLGIAPKSDLYVAKVADDNGDVLFENLIDGINWAIKQNVDIINISLEFSEDNEELHNVIKKAAEQGIIILASSGNLKFKGDTSSAYPSVYPEVISVGMLNIEGKIYSEEFIEKKVDVFAPGEDIVSTYFNDKMTLDGGVSYATAYATGYAALLIEKFRLETQDYNNEVIKENLKKYLESDM